MGMSDTYANNSLDWQYGANKASAAPGTIYVALMNVASTNTTFGTEVSGSAYARVAVTNNGTNFGAAASRQKKNATAVTFVTATGAWTTANAVSLLDHASNSASANVIDYGNLGSAKTIASGETPVFAINAIVISK